MLRQLIPALAAVAVACTPPPEPADLVIRGARLIDGSAEGPRAGTVVVAGGRIREILAPDAALPPAETVIDGRGRYLIPGLWDMHVHLNAMKPRPEGLAELLRHGVTTARDMGGHQESLREWRGDIERGERIGPRLLVSGPTLNDTAYGSWHREVRSEEEARETVAELAAAGVDQIKIHREMQRPVFEALLDEAAAHDLQVVGHIPFGIDAIEACRSGMAGIEHMAAIAEAILQRADSPAPGIREMIEELEGEAGQRLWNCLRDRGVAVTPNLAMYPPIIAREEDPERRAMGERLLGRLTGLVGAMHEAGVTILAGTDSPGLEDENPFGAALHLELELLVEAGLSPLDALRAATCAPAEFVGLGAEVGTIEPGKRADLVLLAADPLEAIGNVRRIETVIRDGRVVGR